VRRELKGSPTGICLYASGDLTRANVVKKGDILAKDGLEVAFANSLSGRLGSVDPGTHKNVSTEKHAHTCNWRRDVGDDRSFEITPPKWEFAHQYTLGRKRPWRRYDGNPWQLPES